VLVRIRCIGHMFLIYQESYSPVGGVPTMNSYGATFGCGRRRGRRLGRRWWWVRRNLIQLRRVSIHVA
jgi:hypothetical protein